ncbi:para-nitrobenzyl esterase [Antricoccus suffuscus]|uniref:Carboxylic ester hydrolase n=2 Tax=Antricoccus suffuscus TaxID=1629062 RepID=A0A2T1A663_9ACTN|nr:para-nitrobenzyl esterase [Antricoccus suffuscus]
MVDTPYGRVRGARDGEIRVFKGIPYGAPTSGANRFRPPQPAAAWTGVRECLRYGETAPQSPGRLAEGGTSAQDRPVVGEDCLQLNVWTPAVGPGTRPVMVWLHGGGFEAGSGSRQLYDGANLCRRGDVVVVTINHRLGLFGHCFLGDLAGEEFSESGNVGFLDIVAALEWVRDSIAQFGGDPDCVTIFGESGGGRKVSLAMASPAAQGLFHRGIVQSGSHLRLTARDDATRLATILFEKVGLPVGDVAALQALPIQDLIDANIAVQRETGQRFTPVLDDAVFDAHPWDPVAPATSANIPLLVGTCRTELSYFSFVAGEDTKSITDEDLPTRLARYLPAAVATEVIEVFRASNSHASPPELYALISTARTYWLDSLLQAERKAQLGGAPVFAYRLMWRTPFRGGALFSPHTLDLPFMFDNVDKPDHVAGRPSADTAALAEAMSESWLAFARTGDPNNQHVPAWAPYSLDRRTEMLFDAPLTVVDDPFRGERATIEQLPTQQLGGGLLVRLPL